MDMKTFIIILTLFTFYSCSHSGDKGKITTIDNSLLTIEKVTEQEYLQVKKNYQNSITVDSSIKKVDSLINIPLKIGSYKSFKDKIKGEEDEGRVEFKYIGRQNSIDISILEVGYWEGGHAIIVDNQNGETFDFWSVPIISSDNKKLATYLESGLEGYPVGIQIWHVQQSKYYKLDKLIEINQTQWDPKEICWDDNNTLFVRAINFPIFEKVQGDTTRTFYLKIKINNP
jgi:hypothetical protein